MRTIFPAWSDTAFRVALVLGVLVAVAAVVGPMIYVRTPYHQQREFPLGSRLMQNRIHRRTCTPARRTTRS